MNSNRDIEKFKNNKPMPNKRGAWKPICNMLSESIKTVGRNNFASFVMPSATLWDIIFLRKNKVPDKNAHIVEMDRMSFEVIRNSCKSVATDSPLEIGQRMWAEDGNKFDWFNLDFCGPVSSEVVQLIGYISERGMKEGSIITLTAKCSREQKSQKDILDKICEAVKADYNLPLQKKREIFMKYVLLVIPLKYGWFPEKRMTVRYREDRYRKDIHSNGGLMMCGAVKYRKAEESDDIWSLWNEK